MIYKRQIYSLNLMTVFEQLALQPFDDESPAAINKGYEG
jgi:hypothetical protein